jgi:adenosylhomocysteine nucleosidase
VPRNPLAPGPVAIVAPTSGELAPLLRRTRARRAEETSLPLWRGSLAEQAVVLACTGEGAGRAGAGIEAVLAAQAARVVIGVGVASGLTGELRFGDVVVAREVRDEHASLGTLDGGWRARAVAAGARTAVLLSLDRVITKKCEKAALGRSLAPSEGGEGFVAPMAALDRESSAWARVARSRGVPCLLVRGICDDADDELPSLLAECLGPDGGIDRGRFAARVLMEPRSWPGTLRMGLRTRFATERVAALVEKILRAAPEPVRDGELLFADPASATSGER